MPLPYKNEVLFPITFQILHQCATIGKLHYDYEDFDFL